MAQVQPMQQNVVVVASSGEGGSQMQPQNVAEWTTGICGCFENCSTLIMGYLCFWCLLCKVTSRIGECVLTPWCFGPISVAMMRTKLRTMYGIRGAVWKDICAIQLCFQLAVCQMDREMNNRNLTL